MINVAEGYAVVKAGDLSYELVPSFFNINSIGSPEEIVEHYKCIINYAQDFVGAFASALIVLESCGLSNERLTGTTKFSARARTHLVRPGEMPMMDVIILASHCMQHGMCGSASQLEDASESGTGRPLTSFNVYEYVMSAVEMLKMSYDEAWAMSMTQYVNMMKVKVAEMRRRGELPETVTKKDVKMIMERHKQLLEQRKKVKGY